MTTVIEKKDFCLQIERGELSNVIKGFNSRTGSKPGLDRGLGTSACYPYIKKRRNSGQIMAFHINPTKIYMLQLLINIYEPI